MKDRHVPITEEMVDRLQPGDVITIDKEILCVKRVWCESRMVDGTWKSDYLMAVSEYVQHVEGIQ